MIICPDCHKEFSQKQEKCQYCSFVLEKTHGIDVFLSSKDKKNPIFNAYMDNYSDISNDDLSSHILSDEYQRYQAQNIIKRMKPNPNAAICDIGSGRGIMLETLRKLCVHDISLIDIAIPYLKKHHESGYKCYLANAENIPFKLRFDYVIASDILEHVLNCGEFLVSTHRALKDNGVLAVRVPYRENLMQYTSTYNCQYSFVHLRSFNKQILTDMLNDAGFRIIDMWYDGFWIDRPQSIFTKNKFMVFAFKKLTSYFTSKFESPTGINQINLNLLNLFFRPTEICVLAKKN